MALRHVEDKPERSGTHPRDLLKSQIFFDMGEEEDRLSLCCILTTAGSWNKFICMLN